MPVGEVGEIWTRTPQNMKGYWNQPEATAATIDADGWLRTGDAGYLDADGYLYIHDRVKDMIVSGGENVYPAEVENVLMAHPAVADVAVVGVPDERWGETGKAIVVKAEGAEVTPEEIIDFCRPAPRQVQVPDERRVHRRPAAQPERQGAQEGHPRAVLGRLRTQGALSAGHH